MEVTFKWLLNITSQKSNGHFDKWLVSFCLKVAKDNFSFMIISEEGRHFSGCGVLGVGHTFMAILASFTVKRVKTKSDARGHIPCFELVSLPDVFLVNLPRST